RCARRPSRDPSRCRTVRRARPRASPARPRTVWRRTARRPRSSARAARATRAAVRASRAGAGAAASLASEAALEVRVAAGLDLLQAPGLEDQLAGEHPRLLVGPDLDRHRGLERRRAVDEPAAEDAVLAHALRRLAAELEHLGGRGAV